MYNIRFENEEKRAKILIIDDEELILQSLEMVLERYFDVIKLTDPLKAMDTIEKEKIDIVISDEMMPGLRGCELSQRIHETYPNICKIILSGNSDKKDIVKAINNGHIFSFLFKPVDINQLLQAVKQGLENKRMKETIEENSRKLEEKNRSLLGEVLKKTGKIHEMEKFYELGKFSASIVHDLNSPLQTLITGYQLLEDEVYECIPKSESVTNVLSIIDQSLGTMENMIKSISERIKNNYSLKPVLFDVNSVLKKNLNYMKLKYKEKLNVSYKTDLDESLPRIKGVPLHFDQIFSNILKNSFDAMEKSPEKILIIKSFIRSDKLCIYFKDTGSGIKHENIDKIFNTGFSTKEPGKGTGLGLVITKQMVNSYKGMIKVESEENNGAAFLICFPLHKKK